MNWYVNVKNIKGSLKKLGNNRCQDKIFYNQNDDFLCLVLADGIGSNFYGDIGAEIACKTASEYINRNFDNLYSSSNKDISYKILGEISRKLRRVSVFEGYDFKSLGSTLNIVAVKNLKYFTLFLGDGLIGCLNNKIHIISYFDSNKSRKVKYLTTGYEAYKKAIVTKGNSINIKSFFILSDGVVDYFYKYEINEIEKKLYTLSKENLNFNLDKIIEINNPKDDFSYLIANRTL